MNSNHDSKIVIKSPSYIDNNRDLRLDFLRGYTLFAMAIYHFSEGSYYRNITGGSVFLINAAEVFFFISGFTLGFISLGKPLTLVIMRTLKRTRTIYLFTVTLTLIALLFLEEVIFTIREFDQPELLID